MGVPFAGKYKEIFNSDAAEFGGEGVVNSRVKTAKAEECDEREHSIKVKLPALGVSIFSCTPGKAPAKASVKAPTKASAKAPAKKKVTAAKTTKTTKITKTTKTTKARKKTTANVTEKAEK